jgi:hypothetical protein
MTDRDVEREIEANEQRANDEARDDDEGILDTAEDALSPITDAIGRADDDDDEDAAESQRRLNDEEQRRGE